MSPNTPDEMYSGAGPQRRGLFGPLFGSPAIDRELTDAAWLQAMLDVERALAAAEAAAGVIPADAAAAIAAACRADRFDTDSVGRRAEASGNPVVPLVADLEAAVAEPVRPHVHLGATSQDVLDTAASLVAHRSLAAMLDDAHAVADRCAALAEEHRSAVMAGRTLLQHAVPTTFGARCAAWLVAVDEVVAALLRVRDHDLAVQLGGAVGTLAALGDSGPAVVRGLATELGLSEPPVPWHTDRVRPATLATTLGLTAGVLGKIAGDVVLLAQTEVGEVSEALGEGRGGSSAMPQKRNSVDAVLVVSAARRAPSLVATILAVMPQEHERAAGGWHAEWETLTALLRLVGGAAARTRSMLDGLDVDVKRMRANVEATRGLIMAESVATRLARTLGRSRAQELVSACCGLAVERGLPLRETLLDDDEVRRHLSVEDVDAALDPTSYMGAADRLVDRALAAHHALRAARDPG